MNSIPFNMPMWDNLFWIMFGITQGLIIVCCVKYLFS